MAQRQVYDRTSDRTEDQSREPMSGEARRATAGEPRHPATPMEKEAESFTGGPGVVATKSQARGATGGGLVGLIIGAVLGAILGAILFKGAFGMLIGAIALGAAGLVAGGVSGGATNPARNLDHGEADT